MRAAATIFVITLALAHAALAAEPAQQQVGAGGYLVGRPATAKGPPHEIYTTSRITDPVPTNDWWSSLAWMPFSERQYPHPLAVQAEARGLRVFYPGNNITANKDAIFGFMPADGNDDLVLGHSRQEKFADARLDGFSDWFVTAKFAADDNSMSVTYGHGSPYVFGRFVGGSARLTFAKQPQVWFGDKRSAVLGITVNGKHYGLFAPAGATWSGLDGTTAICASDKDYFSLALLPNAEAATLKRFQKFAHCHITDSRVTPRYTSATATVETNYTVETESLEGDAQGTLLALYPHQWKHTSAKLLDGGFASVRGEMKLVEGETFVTQHRFPGVLPSLPRVSDKDDDVMAKLLEAEVADEPKGVKDTYWDGKWLGKKATLIPIAEAYGDRAAADKLRRQLKQRLESWLVAANTKGQAKPEQVFWYDKDWGTLIGHPASYGSDVELNDHHFHYGYFVRAAAEIARTDPEWAKKWGPMIEIIVRDMASHERDDPLFPYLRNFDPYAGHSWASGHAKFGDGNNNESSSEAMNAWYGMILWGEFTGNRPLRDTGVYLYTTEMNAIQEYWFDVHDENHPKSFTPSVVTMVWGGKGANGTWFSNNPEMVHGINWLPMHGGSLYLGHYPAYAEKNYAALKAENGDKPWDAWADLVWMYRALSSPADAQKQFKTDSASAPQEDGNSLANTYHWINSLQVLGNVNAEITGDAPLCAVFDRGDTRTYVAYVHTQGGTINFSDSHKLTATKSGLHQMTKKIK